MAFFTPADRGVKKAPFALDERPSNRPSDRQACDGQLHDGKVWNDPKYNKWRAKLYKKEGIKVDKNNKIIDFEKIIYSF